jgi:hypothetical protein
MVEIEAAHVAEFDPLQVPPQPFTGIQFRRIGGQALHVEAWGGPSGQELFDEVTAMNRRPVPEDQQTAGHLAQQMLQKGHDIDGVDRRLLAVTIQLTFWRDGTDRREMIPGPPFPEDGCLTYWSIRADATGPGREPGFIDEAERLPLGFGPFLSAGQVSSRQRVMATSSRWRARRAGFCGLQWMAWHKRPTWRG